MSGGKHHELGNAVAVIGQGVREYVAVLDEVWLSVSHPLGGRREADGVAQRIVKGTEEPQLRLRVSEVRSVACRLDRVVVVTMSQTLVLPMFGAAGVWASRPRSVVAGTLGGRPREGFAARLAEAAGLIEVAPGSWGAALQASGQTAHDPALEVRIWSPTQSLGRAAIGLGFAAMITYRMVADDGFLDGSQALAFAFAAIVLAVAAFGLRALFLGVHAVSSSVLVRNLGKTRTIQAESIDALTIAHHDAVRSLVAGRPMIAFRLLDGEVIAAQATISVSRWSARRLTAKAASMAALLGATNEVGLGGLTNDRLGDDGRPVVRAGNSLMR